MSTPQYGQQQDGQQWPGLQPPQQPPQAQAAQQPQVEIGIDGKPFDPDGNDNLRAPAPTQRPAYPAQPASYPAQPQPQPPVYQTPPVYNPQQSYQAAYGPGSYQGMRTHVEQQVYEAPRQSMEKDGLSWAALGTGVLACILQAIHLAFMLSNAGIGAFISIGASAYFGLRAHNAAVRGFASNRVVAYVGVAFAAVALIAYVLLPAAMAADVARRS